MYQRILIANRGEIALRIIRTCKRLGLETVVVHSTADRDAVYLRLADDTVCIGPPPSAQSYLSVNNIIAAAEIANAEAIHPGYGFLAENPQFNEIVRSCNIGFVGPSPEAMRLVGDKIQARRLARENGIPVVPGSEGPVRDEKEALAVARRVGYPVMIKAAAGGGGRGIRVARSDAALLDRLLSARTEAENAFGDGSVYLEKLIESPRHLEIQVLADAQGNFVHLGERDCTVQRRYQKLIEESPSPAADERLRREMTDAAITLLRAAGYTNAGTVEFLLDTATSRFYFSEVNARLQVEHPVTEMVTGLDLVEWQLRLADGEKLTFKQEDLVCRGWALECRINAEDPDHDFAPSPGRISIYCPPAGNGIRVDSHLYSGYQVPPYYDSLLAKLIVHGNDRPEAITRMRRALEEFLLEGPKTTLPMLRQVMNNSRFVSGEFDTHFVEQEFFSRRG